MELPFITHLRHKILGIAPWRMKPSRVFSVKDESSTDECLHDVIVRFHADMFFDQRIAEQEIRTSQGGDSAMQRTRQRAVRAIAHETYGPIERELREVLALLWEDGMSQSEAAKRIDAMLPILRGEGA
jgi:hypothetical protein